MSKKVDLNEWKNRFKAIGLSEEDMKSWHRLFEKENPEGHQSFLEWLGLSEELVKKVRKEAI